MDTINQFPGKIVYKPGKSNMADPLSRMPSFYMCAIMRSNTPISSLIQDTTLQPVKTSGLLQAIRDAYNFDKTFPHDQYEYANGLHFHEEKIVIPDVQEIKDAILQECHDSLFAGHLGKDKTIEMVRRLFVWPNMNKFITEYCNRCETCQRAKTSRTANQGLLNPPALSERPWADISVDLITCLPDTTKGHDSILTVVDRCTKMVILIPTTINVGAEEFADLMTDHVFAKQGIPLNILSDRDPRFTGHFWQTVCKRWNIHPSVTSAYHPQSDGQTERVNRSIEQVLRAHALEFNFEWDKTLSMVEFAMNNSQHASLKYTPFFLNTGRHPITPIMAECMQAEKVKCSRAMQFTTDRQAVLKHAVEQITIARDRYKSYADAHRVDMQFEKDQMVLLSTVNLNKHSLNRKLYPKYMGPFKIMDKVNDTAYRLDLPANLKIHNVFHVSMIKPWIPSRMKKPPPTPIVEEGVLTYVPERIMDHRDIKTTTRTNKHKDPSLPQKHQPVYKREYFVKWEGYGVEHCTWEPEAHLKNVPEFITEYFEQLKLLQARKAPNRTLALIQALTNGPSELHQ
jgi:transposase InsO family protein